MIFSLRRTSFSGKTMEPTLAILGEKPQRPAMSIHGKTPASTVFVVVLAITVVLAGLVYLLTC